MDITYKSIEIRFYKSIEIRFKNGKMSIKIESPLYNESKKRIGTIISDVPNAKIENGDILIQLNNDNDMGDNYIPECCKGCHNHPSNGGSGICNCTAPLYDNKYPWKITC